MSNDDMNSGPSITATICAGIRHLATFPAVQVFVVFLSWAGMIAACTMRIRVYPTEGFLIAAAIASLRLFPPTTRFPTVDFAAFLMIYPAWSVFYSILWKDSTTAPVSYQVLSIVQLSVFVTLSLYRDWYRFRYPYKKPPSTDAGALAGP